MLTAECRMLVSSSPLPFSPSPDQFPTADTSYRGDCAPLRAPWPYWSCDAAGDRAQPELWFALPDPCVRPGCRARPAENRRERFVLGEAPFAPSPDRLRCLWRAAITAQSCCAARGRFLARSTVASQR